MPQQQKHSPRSNPSEMTIAELVEAASLIIQRVNIVNDQIADALRAGALDD